MIRSVILSICFVFAAINSGPVIAQEGSNIASLSEPSGDIALQNRAKHAELLRIDELNSNLRPRKLNDG